jgi:hypothetical protein
MIIQGVSVLSHCLSHRMPPFLCWRQWVSLTWGRVCVIIVLIDSYVFFFVLPTRLELTTPQLAFRIFQSVKEYTFLSPNVHSYTTIISGCVGQRSRPVLFTRDLCAGHICLYQLLRSKQGTLPHALDLLRRPHYSQQLLIYGFLVEKVYIVWSGGNQTPRFKTPAYRICSVVLLGYITVAILMIIGQISLIRGDGMCMIGLKDFAYVRRCSSDAFIAHIVAGLFL